MKYFFLINFSEIEDDPIKLLNQEINNLKLPLVRSIFCRDKRELKVAFKQLKKNWVKDEDSLRIYAFKGSGNSLTYIKSIGIEIEELMFISPKPSLLPTKIPNVVKRFIVFEKEHEKNKAKFKGDINTTTFTRNCINDADFLINSKAIKTYIKESAKRLI